MDLASTWQDGHTFFSSFPLTQPLQGLSMHSLSPALQVWGPKFPEASQSLGASPCKLNWFWHTSKLALQFKTLKTNSRLLNLKTVPWLLFSPVSPGVGQPQLSGVTQVPHCRAKRKHQDRIMSLDVTCVMALRVPGLSCYPGKQSLDARCWPKFRCTQACGALVTTRATWSLAGLPGLPGHYLVTTSTATTALGGLSEVCALQENSDLRSNGAPQKPEMKDKCKDRVPRLLFFC